MRTDPRRAISRLVNAGRKLRAGLRLFGESVSPETRNDLLVAHESIYEFFSRYAPGQRVLDAGCGTGYGSAALRRQGAAAQVVGVDIDERSIGYAQRRFGSDAVQFFVCDLQALPPSLGTFDVIVSSNAFEHVAEPVAVCNQIVRQHLRSRGRFVLAVPPIVDETTRAAHHDIHYHRGNLYVWEWREALERQFGSVESYRHVAAEGVQVDFADPAPTRLGSESFRVEPVVGRKLEEVETITAIFVCSGRKDLVE